MRLLWLYIYMCAPAAGAFLHVVNFCKFACWAFDCLCDWHDAALKGARGAKHTDGRTEPSDSG